MRKNIFLFLTICMPFFVYSQQWKQYSDSIYKITSMKYNQSDLDRANKFIQLADNEIENIKVNKDTTYADYLYRKGYVKFNLGQFTPALFEESLAIWYLSSNKNYMKIMKNHYFLANSYHLKLDYVNSYKNYENCYLLNKKYKFPKNIYNSNSMYYLAVIDYNTNLNYKKAEQYAQEYIEYNKDTAYLNFDFNYAYAYKWMDDHQGFENVLLEFKKNYEEEKLNNPKLYFEINFKLVGYYYDNYKAKECIGYGEKSLEIYHISKLDKENYLDELYNILVWAYSETKDDINRIKYENLKKKDY